MKKTIHKHLIGVIGASVASKQEVAWAYEVGRRMAQKGAILITGALTGVMEAASKGAHEAGGLVVGVIPSAAPNDANPYVDIVIASGIGDARNAILANTAAGFIAIGGSFGTLSEIAYVLKRQKPLVGLGTWKLDPEKTRGLTFIHVDSPKQAVQELFRRL